MSRKHILIFEFTCDHPGCLNTEMCEPGSLGEQDVLNALRRLGWQADDRWQHCAAHRHGTTSTDHR